jgi:hypothetical protein
MLSNTKRTTATIIPALNYHDIPALNYHDAPAASEWRGKAFDFEKHSSMPS